MLETVPSADNHKKYWKVALILLVAVYLCNFFYATWRLEYRAHFFDAPYESADYDPRAIYILNKYDKMDNGTSLP